MDNFSDNSERPRHRKLTPTERSIISYVSEHEGIPCSKAQIARALGRNKKTIDMLVSRLREEGIIVSVPAWGESGRQLANAYRLGRERPERRGAPGAASPTPTQEEGLA